MTNAILSKGGRLSTGGSDSWETPDDIFDKLDREFHFTLDVCADKDNHKLSRYFSKDDNGLNQGWAPEICWCNPPYSEVRRWVTKAIGAAECGATVVMLIPAATDTKYWHELIFRFAAEIRFVKKRIQFVPPLNVVSSQNTKGSAIVVFSKHDKQIITTWEP